FDVRVYRDRDVRDDGFRAGGGDNDVVISDVAGVVQEWVAHVPEEAIHLLVLYLQVRERGHAARAPVDDALTAVNDPIVVHLYEGRADCPLWAFVHGEDVSVPVAGDAKAHVLRGDGATVL